MLLLGKVQQPREHTFCRSMRKHVHITDLMMPFYFPSFFPETERRNKKTVLFHCHKTSFIAIYFNDNDGKDDDAAAHNDV